MNMTQINWWVCLPLQTSFLKHDLSQTYSSAFGHFGTLPATKNLNTSKNFRHINETRRS